MKISSFASIIAATLSAGGAIAGYLLFKPSNLENYLKWKGLQLATDSENQWRSIYEENKEDFIKDFASIESNGDEKWKEIKKYCIKALKQSDYSSYIDKASKWCVDNVQTVRGQMVKEGMEIKDLMTKPEEFNVATAFQGSEDFWALVSPNDTTLAEKSKAYKNWCESSLSSKPNTSLVQNVNIFCHKKKYTNFSTKLSTEGYVRIGEDVIAKKYEKLNLKNLADYTGSNILEIIGGGTETWAENLGLKKGDWTVKENNFKEHYTKYCKEKDNLDFSKEEDYLKLYSEYRGLCAEKK